MIPPEPTVPPERVEHGRQYLLAAAIFLVVTDIAVTAFYVLRVGSERLPQQVVRLILWLVLAYFLMRGRAWARWLLVGLLVIGLLPLLGLVTQPDAFSGENLSGTLALMMMYLGYAFIARALIYSESIRAYFRARRQMASDAGYHGSSGPAA